MAQEDSDGRLLKKRRITRACDLCNKRGAKCGAADSDGRCPTCAAYGDDCTYLRPIRKRGPAQHQSPALQLKVENRETDTAIPTWKVPPLASSPAVKKLLPYFFLNIYPMFPFFDWRSLVEDLDTGKHLTNRTACAKVLSMCALCTARIRNGAVAPTKKGEAFTDDEIDQLKSEDFYSAAKEALAFDLMEADMNTARAAVILTLTCNQYARVNEMQHWLGVYMLASLNLGLNNENLWPKDLTLPEVQSRRRLVWCAYQLDVYVALVWGGPVRHREAEICVSYPDEVDFVADPVMSATQPKRGKECWIHGWNKTSDLYRILEYGISRLRDVSGHHRNVNQLACRIQPVQQVAPLAASIEEIYASLPESFKTFSLPDLSSHEQYFFSVQAANLLITMQNARIAMLWNTELPVEDGVSLAGELMSRLKTVPMVYLQTINVPLCHQLSGIGALLATLTGPSPKALLGLRQILLDMRELLEALESMLLVTAGASQRLEEHMKRLDDRIAVEVIPSVQHSPAAALAELDFPFDPFSLPADLFKTFPWEDDQLLSTSLPSFFVNDF